LDGESGSVRGEFMLAGTDERREDWS
jgi:hypothetical protein